MKSFSTEEGAATESVGPATFYIREAGVIVGSIAMFACLSLFGVLFAWGALQGEGAGEGAHRTAGLGAACVFMLIAVGLPIWGAFRTKFVIDPVRGEIRVSREYELPFSKVLLDRMAGSLHCENNAFEDDWLSIDGPMAEWMREMHYEPDERTMGRDGEFAQALRKVGYDLGDAPTPAPPGEDAR